MKHVALTLVPDALLLAACAGLASAADSSMAIVETLAPTRAPALSSSSPAALFTPTGDDWYQAIYDAMIVETNEGSRRPAYAASTMG